MLVLFRTLIKRLILRHCCRVYFIDEQAGEIKLYEGEEFCLKYQTSRWKYDVKIYKQLQNSITVPVHHYIIKTYVTTEDSGWYHAECHGVKSQYTWLTVQRATIVESPSQELTLFEGESLTLRYKLSTDRVQLTLYRNNKIVAEEGNVSKKDDGVLNYFNIKPVIRKDLGEYFAQVKHGSSRSYITKLKIKPLEIESPPPEVLATEGEPLKLRYKLQVENVQLHFFKNNYYLAETENITKMVDGVIHWLRIKYVSFKDEGHYCAKLNTDNSIGHGTKLTIQSMFTLECTDTTCIEGDNLELKFSLFSDKIDVRWFKDGNEVERNDNILFDRDGRDHTLTVPHASMSDAGHYSITAGNVQKQVKVIVKALFIRSLKNEMIMEGLEVSFDCEAEQSYTAVWYKDGHEVKSSSNIKIATMQNGKVHKLNILMTTIEDKGKYEIKMKDILNGAVLDVKEMPDAVKKMSMHDRSMFLKAAKTGIAVRYYIRIMIVGENGVGKTCLLRRLLNEDIQNVESTDGINIQVRRCKIDLQTKEWTIASGNESSISQYETEQYADCGFWDFAGQKEFYATHQTFLSTNAIYLLVVNISQDFTKKTYNDMIENEFDRTGAYIDFWLDNIHCHAIKDDNIASITQIDFLNPPVIIISTGVDEIQNEDKLRKQKNKLHELLKGHSKRKHIRKTYFLSNKHFSKYENEFKELREQIVQVASNIPKWGDDLPTRWIVLEKEIERQIAVENLIIPYEEAVQFAVKCSFPITDLEAELKSFLKYEHEIGNLIYFDDIRSYIILEPKWLVDVLRCFVSPLQFQSEFVNMTEWEALQSTGFLSDKLIKKLFDKVPKLNSDKHTKFALQIMEKFDIIVKPTTIEGSEDYYIPCMINVSNFDSISKMFKLASKTCSRSSWFCLEFNFLPPAFFNHILVTFVKKYPLYEENKKLSLYRGMGIFNLDAESYQPKFSVCLSQNCVAMQVWEFHPKEQQTCVGNYSQIRKYLVDTVHLLQQRYRININCTAHLKCSEEMYNEKTQTVSCDADSTKSTQYCSYHGGCHTLENLRRNWFQDEEKAFTSKKNNIPVKCHYCVKMPVYRCYECSNVLCDDCYLKHDKLTKSTKHHTIQSTNDNMLLNNKVEVSGDTADIKALPGGLLVFALYYSYKLLTYSVSDNQRNEITVGGRPRSIAILDRNTVVVLLSLTYRKVDSIEIVDIRQRQVIQHVDCTLDNPSYPFCPMFYTDDQLYISNHSGITVMDMSGTIDRKIELGFTPKDMCYDKAARIYCIDDSGNKLVCIDRDGNTIFTFTDTGLTNANRLTIDNEGYVLILCLDGIEKKIKVHRICPDGKSSEVIITGTYKYTYGFSSFCFQEESDEVVIGIEETVYTYKKK
ncbi:uncharacterized protein LOC127729668 isoform X1 [Mytilus californianus]|uniref:uncharacterized protein LOC127729668 isoform X1 n=1 Tax=Mytilus californianus TaxID=6549 RepID=UPI002247C8F9|nr:uncharacterized protein LOC127729668 isoform X1 [Mytilus californianus]